MFAHTLNRLAISLPNTLRVGMRDKASQHGPMPTWTGDRFLSEQLLKDTGLTMEDLGGRSSVVDQTPKLSQQNYW